MRETVGVGQSVSKEGSTKLKTREWFVVCGLWLVACGLWFVVCGGGVARGKDEDRK